MPTLKINQFGGIVPRYNKSLLRENMASEAENVRLWHGTLAPFRKPKPIWTAPVDHIRSMLRFGCCWLAWDKPCVEAAEWLPTCHRLYVTGVEAYPIVASLPEDGCILEWKRVGLPVPDIAPIATLLDASKPLRTTSSRSYVYTYINSFGEEGVPSPPSDALLDVQEGGVVMIKIPAPPMGWDISEIRLYRTASVFNDGEKADAPTATAYLFVADCPPIAQEFMDTLLTDALVEANLSEQHTPPPEDLENIIQLTDGVLAGSVGNQVWFSESYQPQAWPIDNMLQLDDKVIALKWSNDVVYAMTDGHPYAIAESCADGQCCRKVHRFTHAEPIVSRKSAVATPHGVVYASNNGLVGLSGEKMSIITAPWYAQDDWQALLPHTMSGSWVDGNYIGFTCKTGFLFNLRDGIQNDGIEHNDLMPLSLTANAVHTARDGKLYLAFGNVIHEWDAGAEFLPYHWRSKLNVAQGMTNFAAAKITLDNVPFPKTAPFGIKVRHIADGKVTFEREVKQSRAYRLPSGHKQMDFEIEVSGIETVREIKMATSMQELAL
jgi:hypothetical protein